MLKDANSEYKDRDSIEMEMEIASLETGLPISTVFDREACSQLAEALELDQEAIQHIHRRLCYAKAFDWLFAGPATSALHKLNRIADKLAEIAVELGDEDDTLQTLLELALCYSGKIEGHPEVRNVFDPLTRYRHDARGKSCGQSSGEYDCEPANFFATCLQKQRASTVSNFPLAVIDSFREAIARLRGLAPGPQKGSPGKRYRNSILCELARAYQEVFSEAPTCSPNGRFMLICEHVLATMGMDTDGLETAVQRQLAQLKPRGV